MNYQPVLRLMACFFALLAATSCNRMGGNDSGGFYEASRRADLMRVPLVEPYEVMSTDGKEWMIDIRGKDIRDELTIAEIESVGVYQGQVLAFTREDRFFAKHAYYLIHAAERREVAYDDLDDLKDAIAPAKVEDFQMQPIRALFENFDGGGALPWDVAPAAGQ